MKNSIKKFFLLGIAFGLNHLMHPAEAGQLSIKESALALAGNPDLFKEYILSTKDLMPVDLLALRDDDRVSEILKCFLDERIRIRRGFYIERKNPHE